MQVVISRAFFFLLHNHIVHTYFSDSDKILAFLFEINKFWVRYGRIGG